MLVLGVHTATEETSIALVRDGDLLGEFITEDTRGQSQFLIPEIKALLSAHNFNLFDVDLFSVTTGPGSFTGIRVGLATMRALALATERPFYG